MRSQRHVASGTRGRGQGLFSLAVLVVVVGGGFALQRGVGPKPPEPAAAATSSSGAWFCPHGGGQKEWKATLYLANPGDAPVIARVSSFSAKKAAKPKGATLKQLIARTETVADKVALLLGELRRLEKQGFVVTGLSSGSTLKQNP